MGKMNSSTTGEVPTTTPTAASIDKPVLKTARQGQGNRRIISGDTGRNINNNNNDSTSRRLDVG